MRNCFPGYKDTNLDSRVSLKYLPERKFFSERYLGEQSLSLFTSASKFIRVWHLIFKYRLNWYNSSWYWKLFFLIPHFYYGYWSKANRNCIYKIILLSEIYSLYVQLIVNMYIIINRKIFTNILEPISSFLIYKTTNNQPTQFNKKTNSLNWEDMISGLWLKLL